MTTKPRRRIANYVGPEIELMPSQLEDLEKAGGWEIEPKIDGMFVAMTAGDSARGHSHVLKSRDATTGLVSGSNVGDLDTLELNIPEGTVLAGELEASSEWATRRVAKRGYRRLYLYDVVQIGKSEDLRDRPWSERRQALEDLHAQMSKVEHTRLRMRLLPSHQDRFVERYNEWLSQSCEGVVAKKVDSLYRTHKASGKTNDWIRVKKHVVEDYVLVGLALTKGGETKGPQLTGRWGQYKDGKLVDIWQALAPASVLDDQLIGKIVCEFMGWEKFASGALRHGHFARVRTDKTPEECVWSPEVRVMQG